MWNGCSHSDISFQDQYSLLLQYGILEKLFGRRLNIFNINSIGFACGGGGCLLVYFDQLSEAIGNSLRVTRTESFANLVRVSQGVVSLSRMSSESLSKLYKYWLDELNLE